MALRAAVRAERGSPPAKPRLPSALKRQVSQWTHIDVTYWSYGSACSKCGWHWPEDGIARGEVRVTVRRPQSTKLTVRYCCPNHVPDWLSALFRGVSAPFVKLSLKYL